ncbi:MAG: efflux transporter outer membrane subunit [Phycisphaerae bacterium]|nr:efflux transporter outer membrane subunit [Phycisphaerae bacterium]
MTTNRVVVHLPAMLLMLCAGLPACTVGPDYKQPVSPAAAGQFASLNGEDVKAAAAPISPGDTDPLAPGALRSWWGAFGDPTLNALVERAVEGNPDLKIATARVREARALRGIEVSNLYPRVNANGVYERGRSSANQGEGNPEAGSTTNFFDAGLDASWEIDVFGGIRRSVEAADAELAAVEEGRLAVFVSLVAEVARNYVELRSFQRRVEVNQSAIRAQRETLELTESLAKAGISSELEVEQSKAQLAARESQLPPLVTGVRASNYRLSVLLGEEPGSLLGELAATAAIPSPPQQVPVGLPSELLRRRPDIRRAEREIAAATARVGVATSDLFPKFSLTGSFGYRSDDADTWFESGSRAWSFGPAVRWSVFNAGQVRNQIRAASAREEATVAAYELTVLTALEEVENSLTVFIQEQARRRSLAAAETASKRALDLATERFTSGIGDFLNVLDAQRALYELQDQLVTSETDVTRSLIALYKALGGGWEQTPPMPPAPKGYPPAPPSTEPSPEAVAVSAAVP